MKHWIFKLGLIMLAVGGISCSQVAPETITTEYDFNDQWEFIKDADLRVDEIAENEKSLKWESVKLPHTANIEPLVISDQQWQGTSFYRKSFTLAPENEGRYIAIKFEAAMHEATVYLNGEQVAYHAGGYLPFTVNISDQVVFGDKNELLVVLNNEDNPEIPLGKPIENLDFNYYGGLYRDAHMIIKQPLRISDPISSNRVAGGGVFVWYEEVDKESATVVVQTDVMNGTAKEQAYELKIFLQDQNNTQVMETPLIQERVRSGEYSRVTEKMEVTNPALWSPDDPNLYTLVVQLKDSTGKLIDSQTQRIGIRTFGFDEDNQFTLNGERLYLRGTNRHQDYPYIGYALSNEAQYRDAYKIKEAGFNFIRTAHYPPDPAFLAACDELGILFMDAIPGWQFIGNELFQERSLNDIRTMIRRDRNHPSIVFWEASLNESGMTEAFMDKAANIVKEELPIEDAYSSGWIDYAYDIFIPARQHSKPPEYWSGYEKDKPVFIAEYGDWEYYAQNAGFNQSAFEDLKEEERTSRQLRGDGQRRLLQQALNFQEAHNSNLKGTSFGDANWLMFDYNRGYAPDIESSGISDIFRIPKFAHYFYKSQTDPDLHGPMAFIANYWNDPEFTTVRVFSNADEVILKLNDKELARKQADSSRVTTHLNHPPFTFELDKYEPGTLVAQALIDGEVVATHSRTTPGEVEQLKMSYDISGKPVSFGTKDVIFVYAHIQDSEGNPIYTADTEIQFEIEGGGILVGQNPIKAEAGIATILVRVGDEPKEIKVQAKADGIKTGILEIGTSGDK